MGQDILKGYGMETQNRRITAQDMSSLPRYQSGGLIGKIKGIFSSGPEETVTQKYARQDAERAAKAAKAAPPAPTASAPAAPSSAIGSYAADASLKEREAKAMKAAGLKKGGAVRGPGTGTSDDVPIMASNGEFMIKASAVKKIGIEALEALNAIGDKKGAGKKKGAIREMATGIPHMESAGSVDEAQRRAQMLANIPTGGNPQAPAAQPANWNTDTDLGRNVNNTISALAPVAVAAPLAYGASRLGQTLGGAGRAAFVAPSAVKAYGTAAAGLGALAAASSPSATPVQSPVSPQAATNPAGTSPASPFAGTPHPMGPQIDPDAPSLRGRPGADVSGAPGVSKFVENGKTLYSNVAGDNAAMMDKKLVGIVPGGAVRTLGSYGGGGADEALQAARMAAVERGDIESVRATYGGNFGGKTKADYATDPIQNTIRSLANGPMTAKRAAAMAQLQGGLGATIAGQGQASSSAAANQLARDKFGVEAKSAGIDQEVKSNMLAAQKIMADPNATPAQKAAAEENYRAWQGKYAKEATEQYAYAPGGQSVDPTTGQTVTQPGVIYNKATGEIKQQGGQKSIQTDPRATAIKNNAALSREQKITELKKIGYQ